MAKYRTGKESIDSSSSSMPSEQRSSESNKQKISKIYDMFSDLKKENIAKILQFYDDDESQAIDAIQRDGGREALENFTDSGNGKNKSKNKKKKKKPKKDSDVATSATASFDADDSSSLHSSNVDGEGSQRTETENGINDNAASDSAIPPLKDLPLDSPTDETEPRLSPEARDHSDNSRVGPEASLSRTNSETRTSGSPMSDVSEKRDGQGLKKDRFRPIGDHSKAPQRQRTNSFRRSKTPSVSEEQPNLGSTTVATKRGFDKCKKDLNRQTISLQRIQTQLERNFEDSEKNLKNVFTQLQLKLQLRQKEVEEQLRKTKIDAFNLLKSRQDLSAELKKKVDRTPTLTELQWSDLRQDVKQFVTERKYDDDLGKTIWFQWTEPSEVFCSFGEVQSVKNNYSRSNPSVGSGDQASKPGSSLAGEDIVPREKRDSQSATSPGEAVADSSSKRDDYQYHATNLSHPAAEKSHYTSVTFFNSKSKRPYSNNPRRHMDGHRGARGGAGRGGPYPQGPRYPIPHGFQQHTGYGHGSGKPPQPLFNRGYGQQHYNSRNRFNDRDRYDNNYHHGYEHNKQRNYHGGQQNYSHVPYNNKRPQPPRRSEGSETDKQPAKSGAHEAGAAVVNGFTENN